MPIGPKSEKRPVSVVQNAHKVFQIATGQINEAYVYVDGKPWPAERVPMLEAKKSKKRTPKD